jgi:hypothetical protein
VSAFTELKCGAPAPGYKLQPWEMTSESGYVDVYSMHAYVVLTAVAVYCSCRLVPCACTGHTCTHPRVTELVHPAV